MKKLVLATGALALLTEATSARDLIDILQDKGTIDKGEAIEAEAAEEAKGGPALPPLPGWLDKVTFSGDVRVRNESFFRKDTTDRVRQRLRMRFGAKVKVNSETEAAFRIGTATDGDPISQNLSFDETFTFREIDLSNAYIKVAPASTLGFSRPYFELMAGKFDQPFYQASNLQFDRDLAPEGFFESFKIVEQTDGFLRALNVNLGQFIFDEVSDRAEGAMYGFQGFAYMVPVDGMFWNVHLTNFLYNRESLIARAFNGNPQLSISNTVVFDDGTVIGGRRLAAKDLETTDPMTGEIVKRKVAALASDFNVINPGTDLTILTGAPAWPLRVFAELVNNTEATGSADTGYVFGAGIGNNKDQGDFNFTYAYERLETDAVVSAFSDSDLGRDGGTNTEGHILQITYVMLKNLLLVSTAWIVEPVDDVSGRSRETEQRWQVDLIARF